MKSVVNITQWRKRARGVVLLAPWVVAAPGWGAVSFQWVTVGNPGNAADTLVMTKGGSAADLTSGYGSVGYSYQIAKTSVTNAQYVEFLNSVDPTGANGLSLWKPLWSDTKASNGQLGVAYDAGYDRNTNAATGSKYFVKPGRANYPASWINWLNGARFVNWLSNGQGSGNTEDGVYDLSTYTRTSLPTRKPGATVFIPSDNEYYKAAYYDPTKNGTGGYWQQGNRSDTVTPSAPPGTSTSANAARTDGTYWQTGTTVNGDVNYMVDVGSYPTAQSYYGMLDAEGQVYNWTEASRGTSNNPSARFPVLRGGTWFRSTTSSGAAYRFIYTYADQDAYAYHGLRVAGLATVPGPGALTVTGAGDSVTLNPATNATTVTLAGEYSSITIGAGGSVTVATTNRAVARHKVLVTSGLSLVGKLELTNNDLVVKGGNFASIRSAVAAWYAQGTFAGVGTIVSSAAGGASGLTTLAVVANSALGLTTFDGVAVGSGDVVVKYTYVGDTDLSGVVDETDLQNLIKGIRNNSTGWTNGDTNYDGVVNALDYANLLTAFRYQGDPLGDARSAGASTGSGATTGAGVIPEPSGMLLLAGMVPLMARRRRR